MIISWILMGLLLGVQPALGTTPQQQRPSFFETSAPPGAKELWSRCKFEPTKWQVRNRRDTEILEPTPPVCLGVVIPNAQIPPWMAEPLLGHSLVYIELRRTPTDPILYVLTFVRAKGQASWEIKPGLSNQDISSVGSVVFFKPNVVWSGAESITMNTWISGNLSIRVLDSGKISNSHGSSHLYDLHEYVLIPEIVFDNSFGAKRIPPLKIMFKAPILYPKSGSALEKVRQFADLLFPKS